jgi:hypothetical protein
MRLRCDQAIRELTASADVDANPALAAHIASCPDCAAWAEDGARLLRDWHATRPAEPTTEVWDALWARVCAQPDAPAASTARPDVIAMPERPSRRNQAAVVVLGLAQAAAVLAAVLFLPGRQPQQGGKEPTQATLARPAGFDVPPGQLAIIHSENDGTLRLELRDGDDGPGLGSSLAMFNVVESIADTD